MRKITVSLVLSCFLTTEVFCGAATGGATEVTQIAQFTSDKVEWAIDHIEQVEQKINGAKQLVSDILRYKTMLENLADLNGFDFAMFAADIMGLKDLVSKAQGLAYSMASFDDVFHENYKGYSDYYAKAEMAGLVQAGYKSFSEQYKKISDTTKNTIKGTLDAFKLNADDFYDEQITLRTLQRNISKARGNKGMLQAAANIALFEVEQLRKMRSVMMSQVNLQAQYMAAENEKNALEKSDADAKLNSFLTNEKTVVRTDNPRIGF